MKNALLISIIIFLTGCETSYAWYHNHPDRKIATIDGKEISVIQRKTNQFDAFGGSDGTSTNTAQLKTMQIAAIEQTSGCKVISAEYLPGTWTLQSVVDCPP